uniref:Uncharacterized protein n=1 Tax=Oryzias latipes TaxID=8090 RepID=A0A3P9LJ52_ORYLA
MAVIISAAETGFTGSLVGSSIPWREPAAYMGTMTGCFFCPPQLTMFRVSMPRQPSRALLQWEPPHWYLRPSASCTSWSRAHTPPHLQESQPGGGASSGLGSAPSSRSFRTATCSVSTRGAACTHMGGGGVGSLPPTPAVHAPTRARL